MTSNRTYNKERDGEIKAPLASLTKNNIVNTNKGIKLNSKKRNDIN